MDEDEFSINPIHLKKMKTEIVVNFYNYIKNNKPLYINGI